MTTRQLVLVVILAGCEGHQPQRSPLGVLDAKELVTWQAECSTPLLEQRVCGRFTPDKCDGHFHTIQPSRNYIAEDRPGSSATLKRTCASEGWGVWTDASDRIIAFCIAPSLGVSESRRMYQFLERHRGKAVADKIDQHVTGHDTDESTRYWSSWTAPKMVPQPPEMRGEDQCIEFELNP